MKNLSKLALTVVIAGSLYSAGAYAALLGPKTAAPVVQHHVHHYSAPRGGGLLSLPFALVRTSLQAVGQIVGAVEHGVVNTVGCLTGHDCID